jgi:hypothetical protein
LNQKTGSIVSKGEDKNSIFLNSTIPRVIAADLKHTGEIQRFFAIFKFTKSTFP